MQPLPPPPGHAWYDVLEQPPTETGKFDCTVLDGSAGMYPARWISKKDGEGPFWRVLITTTGQKQTRLYKALRLRQWRPRPAPKRTRKPKT